MSPAGQPHASPAWFLWDGGETLVLSQPGARRLVNLRASPRVAFTLESEHEDGHVVSLEGEARVVAGAPLVHEVPAYVATYGAAILQMRSTPEAMAAVYSAAVRIRVMRLRTW